jgi:H+/Cl- antiporter ClcA
LAAVAFHLSIGLAESLMIVRANAAPGHSWIWWTILTPVLGGLVAGLGLIYFVPAAAGSGSVPRTASAWPRWVWRQTSPQPSTRASPPSLLRWRS